MATNFEKIDGVADLDREKRLQIRLIRKAAEQVKTSVSTMTQAELSTVKAEVNRYRAEFDKVQSKLLSLCSQLKAAAIEEAETKLFDESVNMQAEVRTILSSLANQSSPQSDTSSGVIANRNRVSDEDEDLPKLKVPTFDGEMQNYPAFKALFDDLIHNRTNLKPVRKLHYLKLALQDGKAKTLIRDSGPAEEAYNETYALLNKRFNNKRVIMNAHFSHLLNADRINSAFGIRKLIDIFSYAISGLKVCGVSNDEITAWAPILHFILCSKLDKKTRNDWEDTLTDQNSYPKYNELIEFLENRALNCESRDFEKNYEPSKKSNSSSSSFNANRKNDSAGNQKSSGDHEKRAENNEKCACCSNAYHLLIQCPVFLSKTTIERYDIVKRSSLCTNCFGRYHGVTTCKKEKVCKLCGKKHNTLLHRDVPNLKETDTTGTESESVTNCCSMKKNKFMIIPSAVVEFRSECGKIKGAARVLLDICSQPTLISDALIRKFKLSTYPNVSSVRGVGGASVNSEHACRLILKSRHSSFQIEVEGDVVPVQAITHRARNVSTKAVFQNLKKFELADNAFEKPTLNIPHIDMIVGIEYYHKLFMNKPSHTFGGITLQPSYFGWTVSGCLENGQPNDIQYSNCVSSIDEQIEMFWKIEEPVVTSAWSVEQEECNSHFMNNYSRMQNGQFSVALPLKHDRNRITTNQKRALSSFFKLEKSCEASTWNQYVEFMNEYEELGHMSMVPKSELQQPAYYIPHRCVVRPDASSTKLRVVFNASAVDGNGLSLNQACMKGPVLQPELWDILINFRTLKVAFTADIEKMYRKVWVSEEDRDLQRIFWRPTPRVPLKEYRLNTVTYGVVPSSFLATKCLDILAESASQSQPKTAEAIRRCFYMDDLLSGADTLEEAISLQVNVHELLQSAGFKLRKYNSNSDKFLNHLQLKENKAESFTELFINLSESGAVLGITWNPKIDCFSLKINLPEEAMSRDVTKRVMLSEIARTFDPLGLISPVSILGKILIQRLWIEGLHWDDPIPDPLRTEYVCYRNNLRSLHSFKVNRFINLKNSSTQIVGFSDASAKAMAAVIYARWLEGGVYKSNIVCSKTKVAPLKGLTIPKLELEAAVLLAKMVARVCKQNQLSTDAVICFTDAKVVLSWLNKPPEKWNPFVSNRVRKIIDLIPNTKWFYVGTKENPADLATRGISADLFSEVESVWLEGPTFLCDPDDFIKHCVETNLLKGCFSTHNVPNPQVESVQSCSMKNVIESFSSYERLISTFARIIRRFTKNQPTLLQARQGALLHIIKILQETAFPDEMSALRNKLQLPTKGKLVALLPFLDSNGLIRVGGRLENSQYSRDFRHPVVLPGNSTFVEVYIRYLHEKYYHASPSFLVSFVAAKYRVVSNLYRIVKRVVHKCVRCIRYRGETAQQLMGQLPEARVSIGRPFSTVGTDLAGPFLVRCTRHRSVKHIKMYAAFFVCFCTRAVHIDLLSELSAESFIMTFRRFVARRGLVSNVWSDNATNFQATSKYVASLNPLLEEYAVKNGMKWNFIPPGTPNQGGLHEAAVKSAKKHLNRTLNGAVCTQEELLTVFAEIEAILNSRPLTYVSKPNYTIQMITPGHFLIGDSLIVLPEPADANIQVKLSTRYENLRNRIDSFWKTWRADYLSQMMAAQKWKKPSPNLCVNDIVLVKDDAPPASWPYGMVVQTYPDKNGYVRNVDLLTKGAVRRRGVVNLIPLRGE